MRQQKALWQPLAALAVLAVFFTLLFYKDNKYQTPPPYGKSGIITLDGQDLERGEPVFLIDGWLLTDGRVTDRPTYIGEFSNLQRGDLSVSPHGRAGYRMALRYEGESKIVSVDFPQLAFEYEISLDGKLLASGTGNGRITFLMESGGYVLNVETRSETGYYSGMYFPPALGTEETIRRMDSVRNFAYALAFLLPLALAVFTLFLWRTGGSISRWFGLLCCCYALYMSRYFVLLFSMAAARYWFLVQSAALYGLCFCVVRLTVLASGADCGKPETGAFGLGCGKPETDASELGCGKPETGASGLDCRSLAVDASGADCKKAWQRMRPALVLLPSVLLALGLLIPVIPWAVFIHGRLTDFYYMVTFFCSAFFALRGITAKGRESRYTLTGCAVFGAGLLANLVFSNRFEPIRFFWQFEWCGLLLVLWFGAMMVLRSRRILRENDVLTNHLEEQVKKRTEEVTQLLNERKAFFSDMAHDLKAPVFATQSFIRAIRKSGVGVDRELQGYLDQAEARQQEMARRLQGLSAVNALDKIEGERVRVSLLEMLSEIDAAYRGEAEVRSVHFFVEPPEQDMFLMAQPEKLDILFENLIYNALRATPANGSITVSAWTEDGKICVAVEDTGCGISEEELPHIFRRFYVGENNRENGTGLGLYIVRSIVAELGGTVSARSTVGKGTKFIMEFPPAYPGTPHSSD